MHITNFLKHYSLIKKTFFLHLFERQRELLFVVDSPKVLGQADLRSQELRPGLQHDWQELKYLAFICASQGCSLQPNTHPWIAFSKLVSLMFEQNFRATIKLSRGTHLDLILPFPTPICFPLLISRTWWYIWYQWWICIGKTLSQKSTGYIRSFNAHSGFLQMNNDMHLYYYPL